MHHNLSSVVKKDQCQKYKSPIRLVWFPDRLILFLYLIITICKTAHDT